MTRSKICLLCMTFAILPAVGCTTTIWPFYDNERTAYRTPALRADAIRAFAGQSNGLDTPEQRELTNQLAQQIQIEPDPLVREEIIRSIAAYRTPLATQVLIAGLQDKDTFVQKRCCTELGSRNEPIVISALADRLQSDDQFEVRVAAAKALGNVKSPASVAALAIALDDSDPAMQLVGLTSVKNISDQNFGNDVAAWRQYVASQTPAASNLGNETSVAERPSGSAPY